MKIKRVNMAKPEYATSKTVVWWDMDNCPLPNGYDPSLLAPRIDTELKDLGYNGPLTIVACGNLYGIPSEFLRALSSTGVLIKNSISGMSWMVIDYLNSRTSHSPMSIMLITTNCSLLNNIVCQIYKSVLVGYNLLLAYPPSYEIEDPHHSCFVDVGGEWLWTRYSLLKVSGLEETRGLVDTGGFEMFSCESCSVDYFCSFKDFLEHLETSKLHKAMVAFTDDSVELICDRDAKDFEMIKQSEGYKKLVENKKIAFEELYNAFNYNLKKSAREKSEREKAEREKAKREKAEREKAKREKAEREKAKREKAQREKSERAKAESEKAERAKAERAKAEREKAERAKAERERAKAEREKLEGAKLEELSLPFGRSSSRRR